MLVRIFVVLPMRCVAWTRNRWVVWFYWLNRSPRGAWQREGFSLTTVPQRLVADLKRDGIAITHIEELFADGRERLAKLQEEVGRLSLGPLGKSPKPFQEYFWDRRTTLDFQNQFLPFVVDPRILNVVNAYFEMYTKFYYFTLNTTVPVPAGSDEILSQRWHRDPEDKKTCKIFLYVNDVDETAGPFTYVAGSQWGGRWGSAFPPRWPKGVVLSNEEVERAFPPKDIRVSTGRAGTIIFCDTAGIHKGGYATQKKRVLFTGGYYSLASIRVIPFQHAPDFSQKLSSYPPAVRYALTLPAKGLVTKVFFRFKKSFSASGYE